MEKLSSMSTKNKIIAAVVVIALFIAVSVFNNKTVRSDTFSNPHDYGVISLYNSAKIEFDFYRPVVSFSEIAVSQEFLKQIDQELFFVESLRDFDKKIFVAQHQSKKTGLYLQHMQVQFFEGEEHKYIFSAFQVEDLSLVDLVENEITETINKSTSLNTRYYSHIEELDEISTVSAFGSELSLLKDDVFYHLIFSDNEKKDEALELFKQFTKTEK